MEILVKGMQSISLSTTKDGLSAIFTDWQIKALATIPSIGSKPIGSKTVWEITNKYLREEFSDVSLSISRASVVNFLSKLHELGLIAGFLATGKGGKRFNYTFQIDRQYFNSQVSTMLLGAIIEEYPDVDMFKIVRVVTGGEPN